MTLYYKTDLTDGQCGLGRIYRLRDIVYKQEMQEVVGYGEVPVETSVPLKKIHGTGFFGTGFVDNRLCRVWWDYLVSWYPIVMHTEPRINANSGKRFVYAMFDQTKQFEKQKKEMLPKFPLDL